MFVDLGHKQVMLARWDQGHQVFGPGKRSTTLNLLEEKVQSNSQRALRDSVYLAFVSSICDSEKMSVHFTAFQLNPSTATYSTLSEAWRKFDTLQTISVTSAILLSFVSFFALYSLTCEASCNVFWEVVFERPCGIEAPKGSQRASMRFSWGISVQMLDGLLLPFAAALFPDWSLGSSLF
jgi:hypothetical protein